MRELDDTYLTSDPYGYFVSRAAMLHGWARQDAPDDAIGDGTFGGRPDLAGLISAIMRDTDTEDVPPTRVVSSQVALDAFALRHHVAEALVRLFVTVAHRDIDGATEPRSLWVAATDDDLQSIGSLLDAAFDVNDKVSDDFLARMVLPVNFVVDEESHPAAAAFVRMCAEWIEHAVRLLAPAEFNLTTAHNKIKHGLVVRARSDLRTSLSLIEMSDNGDLPLSTVRGDKFADLTKLPVIEVLARPRLKGRSRKERQGLEVTQIELDYRAILAEVIVLAHVYAAIFHHAAIVHFADHATPRDVSIAPHPGMVGEVPPVGFTGPPVGIRVSVTTPDDGGAARPSMFALPDGTLVPFTITGPRRRGRIVDDTPERDDSGDAQTT
ncbi:MULTISPECIES: hypothetical protein [unclassified Aeromicrobium]|uniref:hypothetical protein n=1 Tax=unclassified Aeromicrobium TaxID=2633570 RepID=UPI00288B7EB9|nr:MULTISPECIES: hypothetical protein [unclassified Aeromicrobium]